MNRTRHIKFALIAFMILGALPTGASAQIFEILGAIVGIPTDLQRKQCKAVSDVANGQTMVYYFDRETCNGAESESHFCHKECKALSDREAYLSRREEEDKLERAAAAAEREAQNARRIKEIEDREKSERDAEIAATEKVAADEAKAKADRAERITKLKSGAIKPISFTDHSIANNANDAFDVVISPKIRPDGKAYQIDCRIEGDEGGGTFMCKYDISFAPNLLQHMMVGSLQGGKDRFLIQVPKSMQSRFFDGARIDGPVRLVARYIGNGKIMFTSKETRTVPVFDVLFFEFPKL